MHWRKQGDAGELSAMEWFTSKGADVYLPLGHSPDADFIADLGDRLLRVQVKTSTFFRGRRWEANLATSGGNQSWNRVIKKLDGERCDCVFVVVGDGRRWCIPAAALGGGTSIVLGGPKYAEFEVEQSRPLSSTQAQSPRLQSVSLHLGGCPSG